MKITELPPTQRTILITGCSSGIGQHCAIGLQQKGYRVFACARQSKDVQQLKTQGLQAYLLDLANSDSIKSALEQILSETGQQLFALFNNAGFGQPGAVEDLSRPALRAQFETNVFGTQELTNLVLPIMRQQGYGRIIHNSSVLGLITLPFRGAYNASKHALEALTNTMRLELAPTPYIQVSLIEPGPIKSQFRQNAFQQFCQNIDQSKSHFRSLYAALTARLADQQKDPPFTLGPEAIETILLKILHSRQPKARYYVTVPTHMFAFLKRILPDILLDKILMLAAGKEGKQLMSLMEQ